jgi:hypothetical protein
MSNFSILDLIRSLTPTGCLQPMAERRELGVVSLIKDHKFGFIRSSDRSEDTFFHMSEVSPIRGWVSNPMV